MAKSAVDLKNEGNKAFSSGDYPGAVDLYSKAIDLNDKEPLFFTNRAQVRGACLPAPARVTRAYAHRVSRPTLRRKPTGTPSSTLPRLSS